MLAPWKKSYDKLRQHIHSRDITLLTKVHIVKAMVFLVFMYGYESRAVKKAEHLRFAAFKLWCWRKLLRVPQTARRSNQSILKELNPEYSLEGRMLKLQYFGHLMWRANAGKHWRQDKRAAEDEMVGWHHWLNGHEFEQTLGDSEGQGSLACCSPWGHSQTWLSNWPTTLQFTFLKIPYFKKAHMQRNHFLWNYIFSIGSQ